MSGSVLVPRLRRWIGFAAGDTVARLLLQVGVTAVLARLVAADDFGAAALALALVTVVATFVGAPFEEALAQRRVLRRPDLDAALSVSLLTAVAGLAVCAGAGVGMALVYERADLAVLVPAAALLLFPHALLHVAMALGRRRRRFGAINAANLGGNAIGAAVAVALGLLGFGIWALIAFRVATVLATAALLVRALRFRPGLTGRLSRIVPFLGFARTVLFARTTENLAYVVLNGLVGYIFGLTALGYANMALRIVEPVRGAVAAIGHNLTFAIFKAEGRDAARAADAVQAGVGQSAIITAPVFMGLACVAPVLIPLLAGPGWEEAVPIAALIAIGGMVLMPSQILLAALSAAGRPQHALHANLTGLAVLSAALVALSGLGTAAIGLARLLADVAQTTIVVGLGGAAAKVSRTGLLRRLAPAWASAAGMGACVVGVYALMPDDVPRLGVLATLVATGVVTYAALLFALARAPLRALIAVALGRPHPGETEGIAR